MSTSVFEILTPVILVRNGEKHLKKCLEALRMFQEVVILDNESTDNTLSIAQGFPNVSIFSSPFIGFGPLKNLAISKSTNDWVMIIDSDEVLSNQLLNEITALDLKHHNQIFSIKRLNHYRNKAVNACGWQNDWQQRIFNRRIHSFHPVQVHETLRTNENTIVTRLKAALLHYPFDSIQSLIAKMDQYAELYAKQNLKKKSVHPFIAYLKAAFTFFRDYFLERGILYGFEGFAISVCNANGTLYKYLKLAEYNKFMPVSLAITTFNRPDALNRVLASALDQTYPPTEIIIADDGSGEETKNLIQNWKTKSSIPIKHIWHEDEGFRAAKIRNEAIKHASNPYLIFIDGDMVMERHFIEDHVTFAKRGFWIQGSRVLLSKNMTDHVIANNGSKLSWHTSGVKNRLNSLRILPLAKLFFLRNRVDLESTKTCNMSFWKEDAYTVNGFDEDFIGWGREDSEFVARLMHAGIKRKDLKFAGVAFHLEHPYEPRKALPKNDELLALTIKTKKVYCQNGLLK